MLLDNIVISKQQEVEEAKERLPLADLKAHLAGHFTERSFRKALATPGKLSLIAELKRKSPSKGMLRERFDPVSLAQTLQEAGAAALSVLTDEPFFGGQLEFVRDVKQFPEVPVLRKDFIIDPYQVYESAFHQADAVLLIVRILTEQQLLACMQAAGSVGPGAARRGSLRRGAEAGAGHGGARHRRQPPGPEHVRPGSAYGPAPGPVDPQGQAHCRRER